MNPQNFKVQTTHEKILPWIIGCQGNPWRRIILIGDTFLLTTGAKGEFLGGGWWEVTGYASDGSDTKKIYNSL